MAAKLQELTLVYRRERIRFDNSNVAILECDYPEPAVKRTNGHANGQIGLANLMDAGGVIVKAECEPEDMTPLLSYRFYGHWVTHERHGQQFHAKTFVRAQPHGRAGVIRYLTTTCHGHGVGTATADKLWEKFGPDAVRILREQPDVAALAVNMGHFTEEKAEAAATVLREEAALEAVTIDLIDLLGGRGFPRNLARQAVAEWGNRAAEFIRRSPYLLMRFRGVGFLRSDQLWLDAGGNPAARKRQAYCAWHAIAKDSEGHTWFSFRTIEDGIRSRVTGAKASPIEAAILAKRARLLSVQRDTAGTPWLAERRKAENERVIAEKVREMLAAPLRWPEIDDLDITEHQRDKLALALQASIGIFAGSPGSGKTYTAARLIARLIADAGADQVAVCAPTGKAAVRITEALEGYQIKKQATTIHRLLGVASQSAGDGWEFQYNDRNPLPRKFVIVDESSMIDTDLMAALLRACGPGTSVLLVGDTNQLPPVGHGAPLRDMIAAGVPTGELTKIERNWGLIVQACADIRDGKRWQTTEKLDLEQGHNLKLVPANNAATAIDTIVKTIHRIRDLRLYDPIWGVQVIVAVNKKSELSRAAINRRLQQELNPHGDRAGSNPFRVGDKIVCLKNSLMPVAETDDPACNQDAADGRIYVANGELARVVSVAEKLTVVALDAPRRLVKIPRGTDEAVESQDDDATASTATGCQWDLAYAISCHKAQGSEWPCVIVAIDEYPGARRVCSREWLYTAISRAKGVCLLVGKRWIADGMCMQRAIAKRKTFLKELIRGEIK